MIKKPSQARGFTLIEILVVIGIIAVLAAIVIIAINPSKQFAQARNTQRQSNVDAILNAIGQRMADNKGVFGGHFAAAGVDYYCPTLTTSPTAITNTGYQSATTPPASFGDLSCLTPTYIATFPMDPAQAANNPDTGYTVTLDGAGRVTVCAPNAAEPSIPGSQIICVKR